MGLQIELDHVGKQFRHRWVFQDLTTTILPGERIAITGSNGAGKSTLLKIASGLLTPSAGKVHFYLQDSIVDDVPKKLNFTAPYLELIQEFSASELIAFHVKHRPLLPGWETGNFLEACHLYDERHKIIRHYSTGMQQRLRLALAIFTDSDLVCLDEPTSNLDEHYKQWYQELLEMHLGDRTLIIASNERFDYRICGRAVALG